MLTEFKISVNLINDAIARVLSMCFSSIYCFYVFSIVALLPLVWPRSMYVIQYISSGYLQLVALPLLAYAANIVHVAQKRHTHELKALHEKHTETILDLQSKHYKRVEALHQKHLKTIKALTKPVKV